MSVSWAWAGRIRPVQGEHVEGAWHPASTPELSSDRSNPGLRRLLPSPLGLRAREGRTSRRDGLWLRGMRPVARVLASPKLREQEGCWPPVTRRRGGGRGAFLVTLQRIENVPDQKKRWNRAAGVVWVCSFGLC